MSPSPLTHSTEASPRPSDAPPDEADPAAIAAAFETQGRTALLWRRSTARDRIRRIRSLRSALLARRQDFYDAFASDLAKPVAEVEASELLPVLDEIRHAIGNLRRWMRPLRITPTPVMLGTVARVQYQPRGRVLIIAPWNYPLNLCVGPLVSALAAGNTAILKPSELTPAVSALLARLVGETFPPSEVALFEGGVDTATRLLDLPFDHIFFTGSPAVGRRVMAAASRHLASVTLELGGKSPTIVGQTADLRAAAETILWGKFLNNGQTCVAPDHVYVHASVRDAFVIHCRDVIAARYGAGPDAQRRSGDLTRIVNPRHTARISELLSDALNRGARILTGGDVDARDRFVAPTLLDRIAPGSRIMEEEIFGPLLPLLDFTDIDPVIADINARPKPLALYVFSRDRGEIGRILEETSSGGACVNHCVMQFAHGGLPFGGVNNSGIGNAHGVFGFRAFSHERAVLRATPLRTVRMFFPPYRPSRTRLIRRVVDLLRLPTIGGW